MPLIITLSPLFCCRESSRFKNAPEGRFVRRGLSGKGGWSRNEVGRCAKGPFFLLFAVLMPDFC